jgi:hypothetical protein
LTPAHNVFRDMMTKKCMQFHVSFPKQTKCNTYMCTLENDVTHEHLGRKRSFLVACDFDVIIFFKVYFNWEELKWLQICEFLIEIIFILFLNSTLFCNIMLPVKRYLAMNTFCRSMTYYQKSYSLQLKGLCPLLYRRCRQSDLNLELVTKMKCGRVMPINDPSLNW